MFSKEKDIDCIINVLTREKKKLSTGFAPQNGAKDDSMCHVAKLLRMTLHSILVIQRSTMRP